MIETVKKYVKPLWSCLRGDRLYTKDEHDALLMWAYNHGWNDCCDAQSVKKSK